MTVVYFATQVAFHNDHRGVDYSSLGGLRMVRAGMWNGSETGHGVVWWSDHSQESRADET